LKEYQEHLKKILSDLTPFASKIKRVTTQGLEKNILIKPSPKNPLAKKGKKKKKNPYNAPL